MEITEGLPLMHSKSIGLFYPWLKKLLTKEIK